MDSVFATSSSEMSIPSAISSTVGSRPSSCRSEAERLPMRCSVPARFSGTRTMRDCSASACRIFFFKQKTAYEMNLMPLVSSNLWAARIRPRLPSLIKSESDTPWFWYFLATETTNRRLERTSLSSASASLCLIRWASVTSSSRVINGYWLISRRYWSSDPSSNEARFAVFSCMAESPLQARTTPPHGTPGSSRRFLPDNRPEPVPANIGQPGKRIVRLPVVTEIHDERPPLDRGRVHEAPVPGIRRVVSIVAQDEVFPGRDGQGTPRVPRRVVVARHLRAAEQVVPLPVELRIVHIARVHPLDIGLRQPPAIHPHLAAAHFHRVPGDPDDPLHVVEIGVLRVGEHDDVAAPRRLEAGKPGVRPGDLRAVDGLVHEQKVAREQRALHAA